MDAFRLLTHPYETLSLQERAAALLAARAAGTQAAGAASRLEDLESPGGIEYYRHVVELIRSEIGDALADSWQNRCNQGLALTDPRVQAFFFGWHERSTEIMAEIQADHRPTREAARARWFLGGLHP